MGKTKPHRTDKAPSNRNAGIDSEYRKAQSNQPAMGSKAPPKSAQKAAKPALPQYQGHFKLKLVEGILNFAGGRPRSGGNPLPWKGDVLKENLAVIYNGIPKEYQLQGVDLERFFSLAAADWEKLLSGCAHAHLCCTSGGWCVDSGLLAYRFIFDRCCKTRSIFICSRFTFENCSE